MTRAKIKNAKLILPTGVHKGEVLVQGPSIYKVSIGKPIKEQADVIIDAKGLYLSPGFIDIHTHGGGGADFMDLTPDAVYQVCRTHLMHGTTSIVPTTIASDKASLLDCVALFESIDYTQKDLPTILGLHLEGPYFAYEQRGAQNPQYLRNPSPKEYLDVLKHSSHIVRWSFAAELDGSLEFLQTLNSNKIQSSLAHTAATCQQVFEAYNNGLNCLTHFYSCMSTVKRVNAKRVAGTIEAGYLLDDMYVEVIADGCHLPPELLRLIYKIKGANHICLVTDAMRGAGMPDGEYILGNYSTGVATIVEDGVAKLPDRSAFAGSVATSNRLVRTMAQLTDAPLHEVVSMASLTPAKLMGISARKGSIAAGKDADLLLFDDNISIQMVMVKGNQIELSPSPQ